MPMIMQNNKTTITMLAIGVNSHFNYDRYFSMVPVGPEGVKAFSRGFFEFAAAQQPKPKTVAMLAADAEFAKTAADGARENAKALGFEVVYDKSYPPTTTDFAPVVRAVQAANADVVFVAAYPPDTVGIVRAAHESQPDAKNVRRHHDRSAGNADQDAAWSAHERHRHHGKLRAGTDLQLSWPCTMC